MNYNIKPELMKTSAKGFAICKAIYDDNQELIDLIYISSNSRFKEILDISNISTEKLSFKDSLSDLLDEIKKQKPNSLFTYLKNDIIYNIDYMIDSDIEHQVILNIKELITDDHYDIYAKKAFNTLVQDLPMPMFITDKDIIVDCNVACHKLFGFDSKEEFLAEKPSNLSTPLQGPYGHTSVEYFGYLMEGVEDKGLISCEWVYVKKDGSLLVTETVYSIREHNGNFIIYAFLRDLTEEKKALDALSKEQEKIINELSTPITQLAKGILFLPLVGHLSVSRANSILHIALQRISETQAKILIVDVAGVNEMDSICASSLIKLSKAVRLMGATLILSSLSPKAAESIINLDFDIYDFNASNNLESAIHTSFNMLNMNLKF